MRTKILAILAAALMVLAVAGTAAAQHESSEKRVKYFKGSISPSKNVKPGTVLTFSAGGATKSTEYYCLLTVTSPQADGSSLTASNTSTLKSVKSSKKGKLSCKQTFQPWTAKDENGKTRHCPTTKADKRAGFKCSIAVVDKATIGAQSAGVGYFTATK